MYLSGWIAIVLRWLCLLEHRLVTLSGRFSVFHVERNETESDWQFGVSLD